VMNYYFRESVVGVAAREIKPAQCAYNLEHMAARFPLQGLLRSWNILSTHDTPRLRTVVRDLAPERFARALQFMYPGTPLAYYGEEIGLEGGKDPDNRRPMIWDQGRWNRDLLQHTKKLAALRRDHRALCEGGYLAFPQPGEPRLIAFARTTGRPEEIAI